MSEDSPLSPPDDGHDSVLALREGELSIEGRLPYSSNYTFLMNVTFEGQTSRAIYKPLEGEEPLWDFPDGLYRREVAAYEMAAALGWTNIPETVVRDDGPYGVGSLQRWVEVDHDEHYLTFGATEELQDALRAMACFDMVANNTDRKSGHCLLETRAGSDDDSLVDAAIWGIDHGLTFHPEPKLRTVIWEFAGETIAERLLLDLAKLQDSLPAALSKLLSNEEVDALHTRIADILDEPVYPELVSQRQYPWPLV